MKTYLHLETGERIEGIGFGAHKETQGEVVFSTGMTGYQESLTDPSFAGQILIFTYPLIGNYGISRPVEIAPHVFANAESEKIWVQGVVVGDLCTTPSHYQSIQSLDTWLTVSSIPGITGVDTRALTHIIREKGCMRGIISPRKSVRFGVSKSIHWVSQTSCKDRIFYPSKKKSAKHTVLIDCGVKHGILRALLRIGNHITRIPWDTNPLDIPHIDSVVVSNGPGDPKMCTRTIEHIRRVVHKDIPYLGICLGHQLLSLAIGADTYKLVYGHRGINQPCQETRSKQAYITSQNHGYAVDRKTIPKEFEEWFINLNDQTNEGLRHRKKPIYSTQFHPEGFPGPSDTEWIWRYL